MTPDAERQVLEYLVELRTEKPSTAEMHRDLKVTMHKIADWCQDHDKKDIERHAELKGAIEARDFRLNALESTTQRLGKAVEDTGSHQIADLKEALKDKRAQSTFWSQQRVVLALAALVTLTSGCTGALAAAVANKFIK
jgi:hypothetical protein